MLLRARARRCQCPIGDSRIRLRGDWFDAIARGGERSVRVSGGSWLARELRVHGSVPSVARPVSRDRDGSSARSAANRQLPGWPSPPWSTRCTSHISECRRSAAFEPARMSTRFRDPSSHRRSRDRRRAAIARSAGLSRAQTRENPGVPILFMPFLRCGVRCTVTR